MDATDIADAAPGSVTFPRINEPAPNFKALTTHGQRTLADYKGKWLVRIRPTSRRYARQVHGVAKDYERFQALNADLLGLSIDSHFAHIAWIRNIKEKFDVDIPFPIIADLSMEVAHAYGMIQPGASDTSAVRATFIIDPKGTL